MSYVARTNRRYTLASEQVRAVMPIQALSAFGPYEIAKIVAGLEGALTALHLTNREDLTALMVARIIFETAKRGELDPERLQDIVVKMFSQVSSVH
jgi:hypothetical protein